MQGKVNNLRRVAAQQDAFLPLSVLQLKSFKQSALSAFSFDLEAFGATPVSFYHSRRAWPNAVQVSMISGEGI